jgi:hypothetical protein
MCLCCCQAEFSSMTAWAEELAKTATLDSAAGDAPPKSEAEEYGISPCGFWADPSIPNAGASDALPAVMSISRRLRPFPRAVCDLCWSRHLQPLQPFHHESGRATLSEPALFVLSVCPGMPS